MFSWIMIHSKIKYGFVLLIVTLFSSCNFGNYDSSHTVEQRLIFQQYYICFDQEKDIFSANACFTLNNPTGTSLKLTKDSKVIFNGKLLEGALRQDGIYYYSFSNSNMPNRFEFQYINNNNDTLLNNYAMRMFEIDAVNSEWSKKTGVFLKYDGIAFDDEEALLCILTQGQEVIANIDLDIPNRKSFFISPDYFETFPIGKYNAQFVRSYSSSKVNGMERGGNFECEYYSKVIPIVITN